MNIIEWKPNNHIAAGTTLRNPLSASCNDMALHTASRNEDVIANRKALSEQLQISMGDWVFAQQTHSDHFYKVGIQDKGKGALCYEDGIADCDALYTKESDIALGVFHADCVAVLLYDSTSQIICAIHSGWQGTVKEITRKTLEHLIQNEGLDVEHVEAYISCAIAFHSFEVGREVVDQIQAMSFDTSKYMIKRDNGKAYVDNKGLNAQMLINAGVSSKHIRINPNDTFMPNDSLFSYRRDHNCGRHMSFILRREDDGMCCQSII